ncbi:MAG TPA: amidase, partial [Rhizomicrobium sp.]
MNRISRRALMGASAAAMAAAAVLKPDFTRGANALGPLDAVGIAAALRHKQTTPLEVVDAAISRIELVNPKLNAVVTEFFEKARARAKEKLPDGPLAGAPYLIKDLNDVKGERTTDGSRLMAKNIATANGTMTEKALAAGMIILGKTNTPEFGLMASTESVLLGPCRNPWNTDYSTGGSSGGAAAAVASGMVPAAHGSDGGGSIRIPASCCGTFGLKPSTGRMRLAEMERQPAGISVENCETRTVRDSATILALSEDTSADAPLKPIGFVSGPSKQRLKIAFSIIGDNGRQPHPDVKAAVEATAKLCGGLGHDIIPAKSPVDGERFADAFLTVWASGAADLVGLAKQMKQKPEDVFEPWTLGLAEFYAKKPKGALAKSLAYFRVVEQQVADFFAHYDAWLTPVLSGPPPRLGEQAPTVPFPTLYDRIVGYAAYTPVHNTAGTPAMSVPLGMSANGLPIGSQFAAAKGNE